MVTIGRYWKSLAETLGIIYTYNIYILYMYKYDSKYIYIYNIYKYSIYIQYIYIFKAVHFGFVCVSQINLNI